MTTAQPRSRRERPAKPALSRSGIVRATLEIARAEGLERATMRRVAQALDTGQASLYVYVANTAELHAAVLDELTGSVLAGADAAHSDAAHSETAHADTAHADASHSDTEGAGAWRDRLHDLLGAYTEVLFAYPGLARSALVLRPSGPHTVALVDRLLGLLLTGGVPADRAAWGVDLLLQQVTATAAEHSAPAADEERARGDDEWWNALQTAIRTADPATVKHVAEHADALLGGTPAERNRWAIDALLAGVAVTAVP